MLESFSALQYLLIVFAGYVNRQQIDVIDYLKEENGVLRGEQRLHSTDAQRRRLAEKAKCHAGYAGGLAQADRDEVEAFS